MPAKQTRSNSMPLRPTGEKPKTNALASSLAAKSMLYRPDRKVGDVSGGSPRQAPLYGASQMSNEQIGLSPLDYKLSLSWFGRPGYRRAPGEGMTGTGFGTRV